MPYPKVTIRDIAIIATTPKDRLPTGEAYHGTGIMTAEERQHTLDRLSLCINELMDIAHFDHMKHNALLSRSCGSSLSIEDDPSQDRNDVADPHYITRLSTHEFFFYTSEPLSIQEFEALQHNIIKQLILKTLQPGLQFILGSFAVKTKNNAVMNVTPHLASGNPPQLYLVVKNFSSSIDIFYKGADQHPLPPCDKDNFPIQTPYIRLNGKTIPFSLIPTVPCITADGVEFTTLIDICADHIYAVSQKSIKIPFHLLPLDQPLSHILISNSTHINPGSCVGPIVHIDPYESSMGCKSHVNQESKELSLLHSFGKDKITQISLDPSPCLTLSDLRTTTQQMQDLVKKILHNSPSQIRQKLIKIIFFLINYKDINAVINGGITPLYMAVEENCATAAQALLDAGAYVNATATIDKVTPLYTAARKGFLNSVLALLKRGANVDLAAEDGSTPLLIATQNGYLSIVITLLQAGAKVDLATKNGATPLFIAAQEGRLPMVNALLKKGANVEAVHRSSGFTPLWVATKNIHIGIVKVLLKHGSKEKLLAPQEQESAKSDLTAQNTAHLGQQLLKFKLAYIKYILNLNPKYTFINQYKKLCKLAHAYDKSMASIGYLSGYIFTAETMLKKALGVEDKSKQQIASQIKKCAKETHEVKVTTGPKP